MVFSSLVFLYLFLPLCLLLYFVCGTVRAKNMVLLVFSLIFYAWGEPVYIFLMLATAAVNWGLTLLMAKMPERKKLLLILCVCIDLGCMGVFKYAGFAVESINALAGTAIPVPAIALPIGISFYTFQALSYVIDVYRGSVGAQPRFSRFLLYLSLFPQLIAGPIVRYIDVEKEIESREENVQEIFWGVHRFCLGLAKKVLLADYCGKAASTLLGGSFAASTTLGIWLGVLLYTFEIYFDFSGYSDMAIGMGRMFGFHYSENFNYPYISLSITEFWRRWHISLSSFFRDYVYIPLGGNRRMVWRNLLIVWLLTGLWHGASWNFVLWGLYFFVILAVERLLGRRVTVLPHFVRRILTAFFILIGWTVFYFTDLSRLLGAFGVMFGAAGSGFSNEQTLITLLNNLPLLILCVIGSTPLLRNVGNALCAASLRDGIEKKLQTGFLIAVFVLDAALLLLSTVSLVGSGYNAFLYLRF